MSQVLLASFGTPAAGNPANIANILAWFKGSDFDAITDGTDVGVWNDSSIVGTNDVTALGGAGDQPVVKRNAINTTMTAVRGTNSTDGLEKSGGFGLSSGNTWTVFAVIKFLALPGAGDHNIFFGYGDELTNGMWMGVESTGQIQITLPGVGTWLTNESISGTTWYYIVVKNTAGTIVVYVDGVAFTWSTTAGSTGGQTVFGLFRTNSGNANRGNCDIAELALYNAAVSDSDRITNLQQYAIDRFGL